MKNPIKVLIVDDSKVCRQLLISILESTEDLQVIAEATNGEEALNLTKELRPDLITMDILMPIMDGLEATRQIMEKCPTPIVIISSQATENSFNALELGALSIIQKPQGLEEQEFKEMQRNIVNTIRTLAEVPVVTRRPKTVSKAVLPHKNLEVLPFKLLALGASTGGPFALNHIFQALPENFPIPIVVTQHITKGFLGGMLEWLQSNTSLHLEIAKHFQLLEPGHIYFAPDDVHLTISYGSKAPVAVLDHSEAVDHFKPSVTALFSSIAKQYPQEAIGGLLTGMGRDGAKGLLSMRNSNCCTFAQSEATSIVFGMPGAAVELEATDKLIDLEQIPQFLIKLIAKED